MRIVYYGDGPIGIDFESLAAGLNRMSGCIRFVAGSGVARIAGSIIRNPETYAEFDLPDGFDLDQQDLVLVATTKPYNNNHFYDFDSQIGIISFSGWEHLTNLPIINGLVYFTAQMLCDAISLGEDHHENTGCLNDFFWNKTGVDIGMRSAFICPKCKRDFDATLRSKEDTQILKAIESILNDICFASRRGMSLLDYWVKGNASDAQFDTFLCYNSEDKDTIRELNRRLKENGVATWFDEEQLPPGRYWQDEFEKQLPQIKSAVIAVGQSGIGPWQDLEIKALLREFVNRKCPVIPLILPDCKEIPSLPLFLRDVVWVDLRKAQPDPFEHLLWGVTGKRV